VTEETDKLGEHIRHLKDEHHTEEMPHPGKTGYSIAINILTDLLGCVLIGLGLGVLFQRVFDTTHLVTAVFTILGGIAGLWTVIRYAIALDKQEDNNNEPNASI
jgi:F0F1-type ATP synthase assembly protein I